MLRMTTASMQRIHKDRKPLLYSRVLGPQKIQCYINLVWCSLLLILLTPQLVNAQYNNIDSAQCNANDTLYCRPQSGDQFNWTDPITFVWRSSAQPFVAGPGVVDINLWRIFDQKLCGKWKGVTFSDGYIIRTADPSCFDKVVDSTAPPKSSSWQFAFKIVNVNDTTTSLSNSGLVFYIYRYETSSQVTPSSPTPIVPTIITSTFVTNDATPGASSAFNASENPPKSKTLTPLLIAVISGAVVAVLVAIIAIIAATRARKRSRKHQSLSAISTSSNTPMMIHSVGKSHRGDPDNPMEASSIHSTTPLAKQTSVSSFTQKLNGGIGIITQTTTTTSSVKSNPLQPPAISFSDSMSAVPITTSDAAMISDAFRKTLRKPDWKAEEEEDDDDDVGLPPEELRRRREAKELLKKELAEEGTGLHSVQRRQTKLLVHKVDEEDDDTTNTSTLGPGSSITSIASGGQNRGNSDIV